MQINIKILPKNDIRINMRMDEYGQILGHVRRGLAHLGEDWSHFKLIRSAVVAINDRQTEKQGIKIGI